MAGNSNIYLGLEAIFNPATSPWLQFTKQSFCIPSSKYPILLKEHLSVLQSQFKACSTVIFHSVDFALVFVPCDDIAALVSQENAHYI